MTSSENPPAAPAPRIAWKKEFETGNASIDHEHRQMVQLLNQVFAAIQEGGGQEGGGQEGGGQEGGGQEGGFDRVMETLSHVLANISAHFALEEAIMRQRGYDQYQAHKADHERLLDEIRDIMDHWEAGTFAGLGGQLESRLEHWFSDHFRRMDSRLHRMLDTS